MANEVLVVDTDRAVLALMSATLMSAGYEPTLTDDFEDASALLKVQHFPFMVTAHRLGPQNGLHLVLRARADRLMVGIVVSSLRPDPFLEQEAAAFGAVTVVAPWDRPADLVSALERVRPTQSI